MKLGLLRGSNLLQNKTKVVSDASKKNRYKGFEIYGLPAGSWMAINASDPKFWGNI